MGLRIAVKINGVNNLSDARYCAGMGVKWLGFCLDKSSATYVPSQKAVEMAGWLSGVEFVGELGTADPPPDIEQYPLDYLQTDLPEKLTSLRRYGLPLFLRLSVCTLAELQRAEKIMAANRELADFFLLEGSLNPSDVAVQACLQQICARHRVVLGLSFEAHAINETLDSVCPYGIALQGGFEIRPGLKDFDEMAAVLEALESEDDIRH